MLFVVILMCFAIFWNVVIEPCGTMQLDLWLMEYSKNWKGCTGNNLIYVYIPTFCYNREWLEGLD